MPLSQLTDRQRQTYQFIKAYIRKNGYGPKLVEIAAELGIRSRGTTHRYLNALVAMGLVEVLANKSRGIRLCHSNTSSTASKKSTKSAQSTRPVLPVAGMIAAGKPIEAIPGTDHIDLSEFFISDNRFVLRVQGDSMIEAGILDGDMVVVEQCQAASNGTIVVALIDQEEATLKRIKNNNDGSVSLLPENTSMKPLRYPASRVSIQGRIVGQFRSY
jgi:repressor LexA